MSMSHCDGFGGPDCKCSDCRESAMCEQIRQHERDNHNQRLNCEAMQKRIDELEARLTEKRKR